MNERNGRSGRWLLGGLAVGGLLGYAAIRGTRRHRRSNARRESMERGLGGGVDGVEQALFQSTGYQFCEGNAVAWYHDASVFDALEAEFHSARHSIHVELYIWKAGVTGQRLARAVVDARRRGVEVRVLVDPVGSEGFETEICPGLEEAGCEVRYFRPVLLKPFKVWGRNHRKLVVVDGRVAFTGGFGIGDEWGGVDRPPWRDANVRIEGPVVRGMQQSFAAHWLETGGALLPPEEFERSRVAGKSRACFLTSTDVKGLANARWVTAIAIAAARKQLWIANAYFVPPIALLRSLRRRCEAEVDVRLLLPGGEIDHPSVKLLQRLRYPYLLRAGARVFEFQPGMMHAKTALVDGRLVVVGSINLDYLSQNVLEEGTLVVDDEAVAGELHAAWERDMARSREVRPWRTPGASVIHSAHAGAVRAQGSELRSPLIPRA